MTKQSLTQERLKELMHYNPMTGIFTWINPTSFRVKAGQDVGNKMPIGYKETKVLGVRYYLHRLAFLYMTGSMPNEVDHINHIKDDNRWCNLRGVSHKDNAMNTKKRSDNNSGVTGVSWSKLSDKWEAYIHVNKKRKYLGTYTEKKCAVIARKMAEVKYGFHKNHGGTA